MAQAKENPTRYRFEVVAKIGSGSLFTVYRARDMLLNKTVALKVLRKEYARDAKFAAAVKDLGRRTSKLTHAGMARVLAVGQEGEHVFLATELLGGGTLHDLLVERAPLSQSEALPLFLEVCAAVDAAHSRHCPHGDLRPHNVLLTDDGHAKVADFGLAQAFAVSSFSQSGAMLRSVHYLAPERSDGAPPSVASDLYSLGVLLYQMLTGVVPFDAASPLSVARKHAEQSPPSMRAINPRVAQPVEETVRRCLEKDPRSRFPSVGALVGHLKELMATTPLDEAAPEDPAVAASRAEGRRHWLSFASIMTSLFILALCPVVVYVPYWFWQYTSPKEIEVPDVVGKPRSAAERALREVGLSLRVAREEYSSDVPKAHVVQTEPPAGMRVKQGRLISAVLSRGAELVVVPDVRQTSLQRAKDLLTKAGLVAGEVRELYDQAVPTGYVRGQSPPASTRVQKGTRIALQVSKGRPRPASAEGDDDAEPLGPKKEAVVRLGVPQGEVRQEVRIVVSDDKGDHVVYEKMHAPGDRVVKTATGYGENVRLQVFLDGVLVGQQRLE